MKYSTTIYLILSLLGLGHAQEKSITIQGNVKGVTRAGDTISLPRAVVFIDGTEYGVRTDTLGNYSLTLKGNLKNIKGEKLISQYPRRQLKSSITLDSLEKGINIIDIILLPKTRHLLRPCSLGDLTHYPRYCVSTKVITRISSTAMIITRGNIIYKRKKWGILEEVLAFNEKEKPKIISSLPTTFLQDIPCLVLLAHQF